MKRREVLHYLERHGCTFLREGGRHTVYLNPKNRKTSTIPRHREIIDFLVRKICRDLDVPSPFLK